MDKEIKLAAPEPSRLNDDNYVYSRVPQEKMAPVNYGFTETVHHQVSCARPHNAVPVLHSVLVQLPASASQRSFGDSNTILCARVSVLQPGGGSDMSVVT